MLKPILVVLVAVAMLVALIASQRVHEPLKVSGFVEGYEVRLGSRVGGRVQKVYVDEGQAVDVGQMLVVLEPFQLLEQKAQAAAQLAEATAALAKTTAGYRVEEVAQAEAKVQQLQAVYDKLMNGARTEDIKSAEAQVELAEAQSALAKVNLKRTTDLQGKGQTAQDLDQANTELRVAQATQRVRQEELLKMKNFARPEEKAEALAKVREATQAWELTKKGYRQEDKDQAQATVDVAKAGLAAIQRQIEELTLKSTVKGLVEAVDLRPGDIVGASTPAISIMDTGSLWIRSYVPENRLNLQVGQMVAVTVDSFPNERFEGKITFIARQAEFTPGNVQTPEDRSKQVFRIKVELVTGREKLRPGMSADVWLEQVK